MDIRTLRGRIAGVALTALAVGAAGAGAPETAPAGDCAKCHAPVVSGKFVHGPVGVGMCGICHGAETKGADGRHTFAPTKPQPDLCLSCHEGLRAKAEASKFPHQAIAAGGCTACHDPHSSPRKFLLKGKTQDALCANCHDAKLGGAVVHAPARAGCTLCHDPHGSDKAKLLKADPPGLCLDCHQKSRAEFAGKNVHGPVQTGCPTCHDPHSAPKKGLLKADGRKDLCLSCHEDMAKKLKGLARPHPVIERSGCLPCHSPHSSDQPRLVRKPLNKLCVTCHADKNVELSGRFLHGPVKDGQCQDCHDPHGSANPNILKVVFPEGFYNRYEDGLYALCFECHEKDIAREAKTVKLTSFRNGDVNLHYVHVHSEKGRSCKACHAVHGGGQEKHVRSGVPFGTWNLPINYTKTADGGTCIVGCHSPKSYSRARAEKKP